MHVTVMHSRRDLRSEQVRILPGAPRKSFLTSSYAVPPMQAQCLNGPECHDDVTTAPKLCPAALSASSWLWVYRRAGIEASTWSSHLAMTASGTPRRCSAVPQEWRASCSRIGRTPNEPRIVTNRKKKASLFLAGFLFSIRNDQGDVQIAAPSNLSVGVEGVRVTIRWLG